LQKNTPASLTSKKTDEASHNKPKRKLSKKELLEQLENADTASSSKLVRKVHFEDDPIQTHSAVPLQKRKRKNGFSLNEGLSHWSEMLFLYY